MKQQLTASHFFKFCVIVVCVAGTTENSVDRTIACVIEVKALRVRIRGGAGLEFYVSTVKSRVVLYLRDNSEKMESDEEDGVLVEHDEHSYNTRKARSMLVCYVFPALLIAFFLILFYFLFNNAK